MEKTIEKKQVVKNTADVVNVDEYKSFKDLTDQEIMNLDRFSANLVKRKTRNGVTYVLVIQFDKLLKVEHYLTETQFNLICVERNLSFDMPIQFLVVLGRLIKGTSNNGYEWIRYEIMISKNYHISKFMKSDEIALIKAAKIKLNLIDSPEKLSDEEILKSFNFDML